MAQANRFDVPLRLCIALFLISKKRVFSLISPLSLPLVVLVILPLPRAVRADSPAFPESYAKTMDNLDGNEAMAYTAKEEQ